VNDAVQWDPKAAPANVVLVDQWVRKVAQVVTEDTVKEVNVVKEAHKANKEDLVAMAGTEITDVMETTAEHQLLVNLQEKFIKCVNATNTTKVKVKDKLHVVLAVARIH